MNMRYFPAIVKRPSLRPIHGMCIIFLVLSALFVPLIPLADAQGALITVDPPSITGPLPGDQFGVDLYIVDAEGVHAWEVELLFDKKVLNVIEFIEGDFLMGGGGTVFQTFIDNPLGYAQCGATGDADHYGVWGEGILATVIFEVMGGGNSPIDIYEIDLLDRDKTPLPHMAEDGSFQGKAPYVKFTYSPSPISDGYTPAANQTVTFDAGDSYDPDGTIVNYHWDWGDGTTLDDTASSVIDHVFTQPNVAGYIVNLTVTDNDVPANEESYDSPVIVVIRDVAVIGLDVSPENLVRPAYMVEITVTVHNYGTFSEGYNVAAYYDDTLIDEVDEPDLASGQNRNSTFDLDTTGFASGTYIIKANVTSVFPGDNNLINNELTSTLTISILGLPPVASFTYSPTSPAVGETVNFDAAASDDPDGTIVSYSWDFGDGDTGAGETTTHAYTTDGTYAVTLIVTDDDGLTDASQHVVIIVEELPNIYVHPEVTTAEQYETFEIEVRISRAVDVFAWLIKLSWNASILNFTGIEEGDFLTGFEQTPTYFVNKTYQDEEGLDYIGVACTLLGPDTPGVSGPGTLATVRFLAESRGETALDLYDTQLRDSFIIPIEHTVQDGYVTVSTPTEPPVASFIYSPTTPLTGETVTFDASASYDPDGIIISYSWDFGDGDTGTEVTTTHAYTTDGTYIVTLTVTDNDGLTDAATKSITIKKLSSFISITASPTTITIGDSTIISGAITPTRVGAAVTIGYRMIGESWGTLATVTTDGTSQYSYVWTPSDTGTYEVNASWPGDEDTLAAESSIVAIEVIPPRILAIKLTGEHDYLLRENVKIRLAAHVKDSATTEPISDADVTIQIFDADGVLWVSDIMVEKLVSTGIYEWESEETIKRLRLEKGVYLAHVTVSSQGSLTTSDILAFHIDPPGEDPMQLHWILLFIVTAALATTVSVWYADHRRLTRKLPELQKRMYYPSNFPFF